MLNLRIGERLQVGLMAGDRIQLVNLELVHESACDAALSAAANRRGYRTPILPRGAVLYSREQGGLETYVVQVPPRMLPAKVKVSQAAKTPSSFDIDLTVAVPYQVMVIRVNQLEDCYPRVPELYWSPTPVISEATLLYDWAMPNHYRNGQSCLGAAFSAVDFDTRSDPAAITRYVDYIIRYINASHYNYDLGDGHMRDVLPFEILDTEVSEDWEISGLCGDSVEYAENPHLMSMLKFHFWAQGQEDPLTRILTLEFRGPTRAVRDV